jgi:hypothetical protein
MATEAHLPIPSSIPKAPLSQPASSSGNAYRSQAWYRAYMDALFETDRTRMAERIRRAEHLIVFRERELLASPASHPEQRALGNALHALRALRTCFGIDKGTTAR